MNFLSVAQADRHAAEKTAGKSQLFLCPLVTLCSHWMQQPPFLIWIFILGTELQLTPTPLHCIASPPPACTVSCGHFWQPQGSKLALLNSFCICQRATESQNVRAAGRAFREPSPTPLHCLSTLSSVSQ